MLDLPPKLFHEHDAVLAAQAAGEAADAAYERLCLFYVAMTRSKRAMYLITKPPGAKSQSANFPRLLADTLGAAGREGEVSVGGWTGEGAFAEGDARWFEGTALLPDGPPAYADSALVGGCVGRAGNCEGSGGS